MSKDELYTRDEMNSAYAIGLYVGATGDFSLVDPGGTAEEQFGSWPTDEHAVPAVARSIEAAYAAGLKEAEEDSADFKDYDDLVEEQILAAVVTRRLLGDDYGPSS
jgi:hypothetical protein